MERIKIYLDNEHDMIRLLFIIINSLILLYVNSYEITAVSNFQRCTDTTYDCEDLLIITLTVSGYEVS